MYPIEKYRFIETGNKTIAISTYAGKTVRGVAKCDPRDESNTGVGRNIAALRCAKKIAAKRVARSARKVEEAEIALERAQRYYNAMVNYNADALMAKQDVDCELDKILNGNY